MKTAGLGLLVLALCFPLGASATDVYKWVDENGTPSYGERPPEGVDFVKVKIYGTSSGTRTGSYYATPLRDNKTTEGDEKSQPDKSTVKKTTP